MNIKKYIKKFIKNANESKFLSDYKVRWERRRKELKINFLTTLIQASPSIDFLKRVEFFKHPDKNRASWRGCYSPLDDHELVFDSNKFFSLIAPSIIEVKDRSKVSTIIEAPFFEVGDKLYKISKKFEGLVKLHSNEVFNEEYHTREDFFKDPKGFYITLNISGVNWVKEDWLKRRQYIVFQEYKHTFESHLMSPKNILGRLKELVKKYQKENAELASEIKGFMKEVKMVEKRSKFALIRSDENVA